MITFSADITPVTFKRTLQNGRRRFNDPRYSEFKRQLATFARLAMADHAPFEPLDCPVKLSVDIFNRAEPSSLKFGDADNHLKAVADALIGICYTDDRLIVEASVRLFRGQPHIIISFGALPREAIHHENH